MKPIKEMAERFAVWRFFEEEGQIEDVDSMMLAQNAVDVPHIHV